MSAETFSFKSEARQLLNLMIHSLYSTKDIFLRELISNASDALDKRRFEALTNPSLLGDEPLRVRVRGAGEGEYGGVLVIEDNGIGMSRDEMIQNLGTIAHSGTKEFLSKIKESKERGEQGAVESLIGQFGVGFYSSFIVAHTVEVVSRRAGADEAWLWRSQGDGEFSVEPASREAAGTTITLHLREPNQEDGLEDFSKEWTLRSTIKRYSDFVQYPIELWASSSEPVMGDEEEGEEASERTPARVWGWEQVNSMKAIWSRDPAEVTDEEYADFYKHVSKDWTAPADRLRFKVEGSMEFTALLFVPSRRPHDLFYREQKFGLQLYANRVLIKESAEELLPSWLRFMKGVVESPDISLNVSREMLQQDRHVRVIKKQVISKTLKHLEETLKERREAYVELWKNFGEVLKESSVDYESGEKVKPLFLFKSSAQEGLTTLDEYIERMKEGQSHIYYATGESVESIQRSPHLEAFKEKGVEVLYLDQPIDEWLVGNLTEYNDKELRSVSKGALDLGTEEERKKAEEERVEAEKGSASLLEKLKGPLSEHVKEVRLSSRLTTSPACLVVDEHALSPQMQRMMEQLGEKGAPKSKRILELNPKHALFERLKGELGGDDAGRAAHYAQLLYGQALIAEGSPVSDPTAFTEALTALMVGR
jgi:molecular chaperone HtpG